MPSPQSPLTEALLKVQTELRDVDFPKTKTNPHYGARYTPLDVVMEKLLPVIHKHKLVLVQHVGVIDGPDGPQPALRTRIYHAESGEFEEDTMLVLPDKLTAQKQGAAITYARRYALMSLFGIVADEDDDGNAASGATASRQAGASTGTDEPAPF